MSPKVSIIMPVYNAEKFLREALDTVLAQTMTDIEVLCVDDGSTDSSLDILHEYTAKDPRVTIFTQHHQYAGAARNLGIKHAVGKYLLFLDADDIFDPRMVEKSYARAEETSADICVFGGELYFEDTGERRPSPNLCRVDLCPETVFSAKSRPNDIFFISSPAPWNKLFRREFISAEGIDFPKLRTCEDLVFVFTAFSCANRVTLLNEPLVLYRQHNASLTSTQDKDPLSFYESLIELRERLTTRGLYEPLKDCFTAMAAVTCVYHLAKMKTASGFLQTYECIRDHAIPELGLDDMPEWTDQFLPYYKPTVRIPEIKRLSPAGFIAIHGPGLRDLIKWKDPVLTLQVIRERIKLLFKKERV